MKNLYRSSAAVFPQDSLDSEKRGPLMREMANYAGDPQNGSRNQRTAGIRRLRQPLPLIAHVIHRLDVGGLENGLVNLINHMPEGCYRHAIVCLKGYSDFCLRLERPDDVALFALEKQEGKDPGLYSRLWRLLRRLRPDIVHTRNLGSLDCAVVTALAGVRHRVHSEHGWDTADLHGTSRKYRLLRRATSPLIQRQIAVSRHLERWLEERIGIPVAKLTHIYNGVDTGRFRPAAAREPLPALNIAAEHLVIGTVGRMCAVKDQVTLARAFVRLLDMVPNARRRLRLVMIGDGPLRIEAQSILEQAGATELAWLPGARDDIPELLRGFDLFALPSLNEGISNTILEAMATGLPVVATAVGGNPELLMPGQTGFLVPASDPVTMAEALERYARAPGLANEHGQAGRVRAVQEFGLSAMIERYLDVYDAVLARPRREV